MTYLFHLFHLFCLVYLSFVFTSSVLLILHILHILHIFFYDSYFAYRFKSDIKDTREINVIGAGFQHLLAGCPLHGPTVDVPPLIAITSILLRVTGSSRKIACLLAHRKRNGARFTNRHQPQSTQYRSYGHYIQNLCLHAAFVNNG